MKAIPTQYSGVNFRSRLEARWAAFFDLAGVEWEYEPIDLEGWSPDFLVYLAGVPVYVEVKPVRPVVLLVVNGRREVRVLPDDASYEKAMAHNQNVNVMRLGARPNDDADYFGLGGLCDLIAPDEGKWVEANKSGTERAKEKWREAGNIVQWKGRANA